MELAQKYGQKIVEEVSNYYIKNGCYVELDIDRRNIASIKNAVRNNFVQVNVENEHIKYRRK